FDLVSDFGFRHSDFLSRGSASAKSEFTQFLDLRPRQPARLARLQGPQTQRPDGHTLEPHNFVLQAREHAANLAVFPFTEDNLEPGAFALAFEARGPAGADVTFAQPHAPD